MATVTQVSRDAAAETVTVRWVDRTGDPMTCTMPEDYPFGDVVEFVLLRDEEPDGATLDIDALMAGHGEESPGHIHHPFCPRCSANWQRNAEVLGYAMPDPAPYVDTLPDWPR